MEAEFEGQFVPASNKYSVIETVSVITLMFSKRGLDQLSTKCVNRRKQRRKLNLRSIKRQACQDHPPTTANLMFLRKK